MAQISFYGSSLLTLKSEYPKNSLQIEIEREADVLTIFLGHSIEALEQWWALRKVLARNESYSLYHENKHVHDRAEADRIMDVWYEAEKIRRQPPPVESAAADEITPAPIPVPSADDGMLF